MYDVLTVADDILKIAKERGKTLTPMQLVKLTYIAHGWALAILKRDLFRNRIEAWKYGPVIPDLYHATKSYGRNPIPLGAISNSGTPSVDPETHKFLVDIFNKYGHLEGITLSYLTHQSGTPWDQVFNPYQRHIEIPDPLIKAHYDEMLLDSQQSA